MNWITAKENQILFDGASIVMDRTDDSVSAVTLTDANGNMLRLRYTGYSIALEIPAPPKMVKKYQIVGTVLGLAVTEYFDQKYEADNRLGEITGSLAEDSASLSIKEIEVIER